MPIPDPRKKPLGGAGAAPAAPGAAPAPAQTPAQQAAAKQQVGTGFVDLSQILAANRTGAQAMGNQLGAKVEQQGQAAKQGIQQGQQAFNKSTADNTLTYDTTKAPTSADAAALSQKVYSGPKSWKDAGVDETALTGQATQASDTANAVATQGGRAALIRQGASGPLTTGGVTMDSALAGVALGARADQLRNDFGGLSDMLAQARGAATKQYDAASAATKDAAGKYKTLEGELRAQEAARAKAEDDARKKAAWKKGHAERIASQEKQDGVFTQEESDALWDVKRGGKRRGEEP